MASMTITDGLLDELIRTKPNGKGILFTLAKIRKDSRTGINQINRLLEGIPSTDCEPIWRSLVSSNANTAGGALAELIAIELVKRAGLEFQIKPEFSGKRPDLLLTSRDSTIPIEILSVGLDEDLARMTSDGYPRSRQGEAQIGMVQRQLLGKLKRYKFQFLACCVFMIWGEPSTIDSALFNELTTGQAKHIRIKHEERIVSRFIPGRGVWLPPTDGSSRHRRIEALIVVHLNAHRDFSIHPDCYLVENPNSPRKWSATFSALPNLLHNANRVVWNGQRIHSISI